MVLKIESLIKEKIIEGLPKQINEYKLREMERNDIDNYANWPLYEGYKSMFNSSLKQKPQVERDKRWSNYQKNDNCLSIIADSETEDTIGQFGLHDIEWDKQIVGAMSIRLHPMYCDKGVGTMILKSIIEHCFEKGIKEINIDVLGTNYGAIKSYKKCGFELKEEKKIEGEIFLFMRVVNCKIHYKKRSYE